MAVRASASQTAPSRRVTRRTASIQSQTGAGNAPGMTPAATSSHTQARASTSAPNGAKKARWTADQQEALLSWMENNREKVSSSKMSTAAIAKLAKDEVFKHDTDISSDKVKDKIYHLYRSFKDCQKMLNSTGQGVTREDNAANVATMNDKIAKKCPQYERLESIYCNARNKALGSRCDSLAPPPPRPVEQVSNLTPLEDDLDIVESDTDVYGLEEPVNQDRNSNINDEIDLFLSRSNVMIQETPLNTQRRSMSLMPPPPLPTSNANTTAATSANTTTNTNTATTSTRSRAQNMRSDQRVQRQFAQYVGTREERLEQAERRERIRVKGQVEMARILAESQEKMWQASERLVTKVIEVFGQRQADQPRERYRETNDYWDMN